MIEIYFIHHFHNLHRITVEYIIVLILKLGPRKVKNCWAAKIRLYIYKINKKA